MYQIGEHVVYGAGKVCEVEEITEMKVSNEKKLYYVLHPIHKANEKIYVPVKNEEKSMHKVISKEDALTIIDAIPDVEPLAVTNERMREQHYKDLMKEKDYYSLIKLIKSIHIRNEKRLARGKKTTTTDAYYLSIARGAFENELADALDLETDEIRDFIDKRLQEQ